MKIEIDPRIRFNYATWYLLGLQRKFGSKTLTYSSEYFKQLPYRDIHDYNAGMSFVFSPDSDDRKEKKSPIKVFIDFEDVAKVFPKRYEWCDVYGMVNPTEDLLIHYPKMVALGPEFGVTLSNRLESVALSLKNYQKGKKYNSISYKTYLRDYIYTNVRRRKINAYETPETVKENYIFHASTLWYNEFAVKNTNRFRGEFLKACQKADIEVDGGLFYVDSPVVLSEMPDYPRYKEIYKDFIYDKRLAIDDYIRKTKESVMVFNTPSVCECHGWKLAEYLCMGKAIVSTPLSRELPAPLVHGENIHFVNSTEELYDAVIKINTDTEYRHKLEQGARTYYETYLAPEVVIRRILCKAEELMEKRNTK